MKLISNVLFTVSLVFSRTLYSQSVASVTMGSLAAYLRTLGFQADLCLLDKRALHNTETVLGNCTCGNIVIAKPNFKDFRMMLPLFERLKKAGLVQRVFLCGPFAKLNAEGLMSGLPWVDGIFLGQLEVSAAGLLTTMSEDLTSWDFLSPGVISRHPVTGLVGGYKPLSNTLSLSDLPFPARDIEEKEDVSYVNLEGSRGCQCRCSFCHVPLMFEVAADKPSLNVRDPELVVEEMERLNRCMGKTLFIFNDSCFWNTHKDDARILRFCEEIARRKLDVRFYVYLKGEPFIGDRVLSALAKAGLVRVFLGIESSVKSSLVTYHKNLRPDLFEIAKAKLDALGINIHIGFITIDPHSSFDDVLSNVEYLYRIGKLFRLGVILEPVRIIPGTSLHRQLVQEGLMSSKLNYDEVTYGYQFLHSGVGRLLGEWKKVFEGDLKDITYGFEYHSTTGELLKVLAERLDPKFAVLLGDSYCLFNAKKLQGMDILLEYFRTTVRLARLGNTRSNYNYERWFAREFTRVAEELAILHGAMAAVVRQNGGERALREVYPG